MKIFPFYTAVDYTQRRLAGILLEDLTKTTSALHTSFLPLHVILYLSENGSREAGTRQVAAPFSQVPC